MASGIADPVEPDGRVPALIGAPVSDDCDHALQWFHSWEKTFRIVYRAGGTWDSASLLMHLLIENEHGAEGVSATRDDELREALGLDPWQYKDALTRLQERRLIEIAVVPVNGEEMKTIRLAEGRFKRYTISSGDGSTSFWAAVGCKVRCN